MRRAICRLVVAWMIAVIAVGLLRMTISAQEVQTHDIVFLVDNSLSVLEGEGTPDDLPTDPEGLRLDLVRFVIRLLGSREGDSVRRVGVISFGARSQTLVPLSPARDWMRAAPHAVREVDDSEGRSSGTGFRGALEAARQMLESPDEPGCEDSSRRCSVVMVTDGELGNSIPFLNDTLEALNSEDITFHLLTFGQLDSGFWGGFDNELVDSYEKDIATSPFAEVYGSLLYDLEEQSARLDWSCETVDGNHAVVDLPAVEPLRVWARYEVLSSPHMTVSFLHAGDPVSPAIRLGKDYLFQEPPAGDWSIQLQGDGTVCWRQTGEEITELDLQLEPIPEIVWMGDDVEIHARLLPRGLREEDPHLPPPVVVITRANGMTHPLDLSREGDSYAATVSSSSLGTGTHVVGVQGGGSLPDVRPVAEQAFLVVPAPVLTMTMAEQSSGQDSTVALTVTAENWLPAYSLEGYCLHTDATTSPVSFDDLGNSVYSAQVSPTLSSILIMQVATGEGWRSKEFRFPLTSTPDQNLSTMGLVLAVLLLFLLLVSAYLLFERITVRNLANKLAKEPDEADHWNKWVTLSAERDWPIIRAVGQKFAYDWKRKKNEIRQGSEDKNALKCVLAEDDWNNLKYELGKSSDTRSASGGMQLDSDILKRNPDPKALAVLVYAGLSVSLDKVVYNTDPIPLLEVLEGTSAEDRGDECIMKYLIRPSDWRVFQHIVNRFQVERREKKIWNASRKETREVWEAYEILVERVESGSGIAKALSTLRDKWEAAGSKAFSGKLDMDPEDEEGNMDEEAKRWIGRRPLFYRVWTMIKKAH